MKTALVGHSGYIANFILDRLTAEEESGPVLKIGRNAASDVFLDLSDAARFDYSVLDSIDFVIFTTAVSGPDLCAREFNSCWNINVTGTSHFIREAIKRNCRVLFFSSDAVFGDDPKAIYTESSVTAANTPYGQMKKGQCVFLPAPLKGVSVHGNCEVLLTTVG